MGGKGEKRRETERKGHWPQQMKRAESFRGETAGQWLDEMGAAGFWRAVWKRGESGMAVGSFGAARVMVY